MEWQTAKPKVKLPVYKDKDSVDEFLEDFEYRTDFYNVRNNLERALLLEDCVKGSKLENILRKNVFNFGTAKIDLYWHEVKSRVKNSVQEEETRQMCIDAIAKTVAAKLCEIEEFHCRERRFSISSDSSNSSEYSTASNSSNSSCCSSRYSSNFSISTHANQKRSIQSYSENLPPVIEGIPMIHDGNCLFRCISSSYC